MGTVADPKEGESPSDYMDRMLGPPGSLERKIGDSGMYKYYLRLWDAWKKRTKRAKPEK